MNHQLKRRDVIGRKVWYVDSRDALKYSVPPGIYTDIEGYSLFFTRIIIFAILIHKRYRTHTGERPFACQWPGCNKEFVQKCALKRHEQTHQDEKLWLCFYPDCNKRFKLRVYLEVHQRVHPFDEAVDNNYKSLTDNQYHPLSTNTRSIHPLSSTSHALVKTTIHNQQDNEQLT
jgi:uncharacterized Zn-finger protein